MPGISVITITAGPVPATYTIFVTPSRVIARRSKSSSGSSSFMLRFTVVSSSFHAHDRRADRAAAASGRNDDLRSILARCRGASRSSCSTGSPTVPWPSRSTSPARRSASCRQGSLALPGSQLPARTRIVSIDGAPVRTAAKRTLAVDGAFGLRGLGAGDVLVLPGLGMATPAGDRRRARAPRRRARHRADRARGRARRADRGVLLGDVRARGRGRARRARGDDDVVARPRRSPSASPASRCAPIAWWSAADRVFTAGSAFAHADSMLAILAQTVSPSLAHHGRQVPGARRAPLASTLHGDGAPPQRGPGRPDARAVHHAPTSSGSSRSDEMARATATSPRTLARKIEKALGTTPLRFAQRLRVAQAVHLLETTRRSVDEVAARVGYADAAAFRRVFRRETGEAPRARRAQPGTNRSTALSELGFPGHRPFFSAPRPRPAGLASSIARGTCASGLVGIGDHSGRAFASWPRHRTMTQPRRRHEDRNHRHRADRATLARHLAKLGPPCLHHARASAGTTCEGISPRHVSYAVTLLARTYQACASRASAAAALSLPGQPKPACALREEPTLTARTRGASCGGPRG